MHLQQLPPSIVVIFGASGDLTKRKLIPALYNLFLDKQLPQQFTIIGVSRVGAVEAFRAQMLEAIGLYSRRGPADPTQWREFAKRIEYISGKFEDPGIYAKLAKRIADDEKEFGQPASHIYYLSIPPSVFSTVAEGLGAAGLSSTRDRDRIVIEKPFGRDLESAHELNSHLLRCFEENQIFRIDHYLGKETVQNLMAFRFANALYEPIWNRRYVDHVQITVSEDVGVEARGGYYETAGALRDMVQNHLLQLLCLVGMEPPVNFDADEVRNKKVDVLKAIRKYNESDISQSCVRGQYGPGVQNGEIVKGYREEMGVDPASNTETFAALKLYVDNWRWQGVPFYLRTGKRMARKLSQIVVVFRPIPHQMFPSNASDTFEPNRLIVNIQPEEAIVLKFEAKEPGSGMRLRTVSMDFNYSEAFRTQSREAYETLLQEVMEGDATLFMRSDQEDEAWKHVMPIVDVWSSIPASSFPNYPAGTWGPDSSDTLLARDGRSWYNPQPPVGSKG
ncbi:MAG TPA: glucose-6-phosphate dehydrogenase [Fimbriimonas sp.]|nr:glucose-6-phosphate dehydrogenase [Fimbriimonas sp.]